MNESIEKYRELVRQLSVLLEDPQPGLMTWCTMFADTMDRLADLWNVQEPF
jgi:hypothetical protein